MAQNIYNYLYYSLSVIILWEDKKFHQLAQDLPAGNIPCEQNSQKVTWKKAASQVGDFYWREFYMPATSRQKRTVSCMKQWMILLAAYTAQHKVLNCRPQKLLIP